MSRRSAALTALCAEAREGCVRAAVERLSDPTLRAVAREMLLNASRTREVRVRQVTMRLGEWRMLGIL